MNTLADALRENRAYLCLSCGKCTAVCPVARQDDGFSPRRLVESTVADGDDALLAGANVWKCLTCKRCSELCPADVRFSEFTRDARALALQRGNEGACTHGDAIMTWMRMMEDPALRQNRLDWVSDDLRLSDDSDTLYFVGCLPYYDAMFAQEGFEGVEIARSTVRLLNRIGVAPRVLADERCCGHDLLWTGDVEGFRRLAELNASRFEQAGVKRIVTACAECYRTLSLDYAGVVGKMPEVLHISQVLAQTAEEPGLAFDVQGRRITYQDPCRLGRHMGEYDAPRQLLKAAYADVREMEHARAASVCCGTSAWTQCGQTAKAIQVARLEEARAAGAEILATACPKCQIHFNCALKDEGDESHRLGVRDLTTLLDDALIHH
jgi:heterodisulfide reductase subunit D